MIYLELFIEFFKIGLFSIGGGLATLPFLNKLVYSKGWYSLDELTTMIAVSQSTPGPIGINMATYVGYITGGILGSIIGVFALVLPSFIIIIIISHFLNKFKESLYIKTSFYFLRAVVTGLIGASFLLLFNSAIPINNIDIKKIFVFVLILFLVLRYKKHPIFYIALGGFLGIIFKLS